MKLKLFILISMVNKLFTLSLLIPSLISQFKKFILGLHNFPRDYKKKTRPSDMTTKLLMKFVLHKYSSQISQQKGETGLENGYCNFLNKADLHRIRYDNPLGQNLLFLSAYKLIYNISQCLDISTRNLSVHSTCQIASKSFELTPFSILPV